MNFQQLLAKMQELDQPVPETQVIEEPNEGNEFSGALAAAKASGKDEFEVDGKKYKVKEDGSVEECGMGYTPEMHDDNSQPPSMSVNINAQGMDDIADLMQLLTKVNPDMQKPEMPAPISMPAPMPTAMPPLKMLPDLDKEEAAPTDSDDTDDDDDIMTHLNKKLKPFDDQQSKDKDEAFANSVGDSEPDNGEMNDLIRDGDDLHKKKSMHKAAAGGDNAMAAESGDLRAQIRAELLQRLAEAKGAR